MLIHKTLKEYTDELASKSPVPGGGGTSSLVGSLGIALGIMVGELTVGKEKYAHVEEEVQALMAKASDIKERLLVLVDEDAKAFEPLSRAYSMPKDAPDRNQIMEKCLRDAAEVPTQIVGLCCESIEILEKLAKKGSKLAISDVGCGVALCRSALEAAALNVFINTKLMWDYKYAEKLNAYAEERLEVYTKKAERIYNDIRWELLR